MLRLDENSKLQIVLSNTLYTNQIRAVANYSDHLGLSYVGSVNTALSNNTTPVDIVAAPAAGVIREIDFLSFYNLDSIYLTYLIVQAVVSSTTYVLHKTLMEPKSNLAYSHALGWRKCMDGALKF